jgi:anti-sigma factor RsiW
MTQVERPVNDELACRELVELVTEYLDGALDPAERSRVDGHLTECDGCATYLDQIRATVAATQALPPEPVPPALLARLLDALRSARREA